MSIAMDIKKALNNAEVKTADICQYAKKAHNTNYSNVYVQNKIDGFPEKRDLKVERIIAEFLCVVYFLDDEVGIRNTKNYLKSTIDSFPEPDKKLAEYIKKNVGKEYERLWERPFIPETTTAPPEKKKTTKPKSASAKEA